MTKMETFLAINAIYLAPAALLSVIVFLIFRGYLKIKTWYLFDLLTVLLPGILYAVLDMVSFDKLLGHWKTLANFAVELIIIGTICGIVFLLRAILGRKFPNYSKKLSLLSVFAVIILTVSIYIFTPALPE